MKIEILDLDRSTYHDGFSVTYATLIKYDDLGDWLVAAGHADGFDGERLIWYGVEEPYYDYQCGEIAYKPRGRDKSQPIAEFVRHDLDDETIAAYVAELITSKTAAV